VDALNTAHTKAYVQSILALDGHSRQLDADTFVSPGSVKAAKLAAGGALNAVDLVMSGEFSAAFAAIRPPGHHAERAQAMGFCLFSNAAIAAFYARKKFGIKRIAVADFDVHHGNGTEAIFAGDPNLLYVSSHQSPCYPGTGLVSAGNSVNLPLLPGSGGTEFRAAWAHAGIPALNRFAPELLIISAGFDAHNSDPLAQLRLSDSDFAWITRQLIEIANLHSHGRVVSLLEGGYDLPALVGSIATHLREFTA